MTSPVVPPAADVERRVVELVRILADAEQELQQLTGGKLDAVVGAGDGAYLLRSAQQQLQQDEARQRELAAMQLSILNAIPSRIALIDHRGLVVAVNERWRQFVPPSLPALDEPPAARDPLATRDRLYGACGDVGDAVAKGVREVLDGAAPMFSLEYPCHVPHELRFYQLTVVPLQEDGGGAVVMHTDVTDRYLAAEALVAAADEQHRMIEEVAAERQRLIDAQSVTKVGSWETDIATLVVTWSDETFRIFGLDPATFRPTHGTFLEHVHPDDRAAVDAAFRASFATREIQTIDHRIVTADGQVKHVVERWRTFVDDRGESTIAVGTCQDITERYLAADALFRSEEQFRRTFNSAPMGIVLTGLDGRFLEANDAFCRLIGYSNAEMQQLSVHDITHPDDIGVSDELMVELLGGQRDTSVLEKRYVTKSGETVWVRLNAATPKDMRGQPINFVSIVEDITSQREVQLRLTQQATLLDAAHDAILVLDLDASIVYWNKGAERIFGWSFDEARGRNVAELFQMDPDRFGEAVRLLLQHGQWEGELAKFDRAGLERTADVRLSLMRDSAGAPKSVLAITTDITERKRLETRLLRAQRLESLGTLAGGIAHDLNNVLAPILLSIELLRAGDVDPRRLDSLETIEASARRGAEMVKQVLAFARGTEGERVAIDVGRLAADIEKIMKETFPKQIAIRVSRAADLRAVMGDATQLHQVLMNLCVNARDAMPNGGTISVMLTNTLLDRTYAGMNPEAQTGPYVRIVVADTGPGIPRDIQDRLFEPFFTTKEAGKGTGLGLSTVHTIVRAHGGFVDVDSEPGRGSRFIVHLPAILRPTTSAEVGTTHRTRLPQGMGELVLVVDDEESIRAIVRQTLEAFGYRVVEASNGAEAVSTFVRSGGEIDVVLTDMAMPVMDGPSTIIALRSIEPGVPIIASSGHTGTAAPPLDPSSAGVTHFVAKPYTAETLLVAIRHVLDERR